MYLHFGHLVAAIVTNLNEAPIRLRKILFFVVVLLVQCSLTFYRGPFFQKKRKRKRIVQWRRGKERIAHQRFRPLQSMLYSDISCFYCSQKSPSERGNAVAAWKSFLVHEWVTCLERGIRIHFQMGTPILT